MKPSLFPVQISKILPVGFAHWTPYFSGPQWAAPKPLPRLFLDPSYGPDFEMFGVPDLRTKLLSD